MFLFKNFKMKSVLIMGHVINYMYLYLFVRGSEKVPLHGYDFDGISFSHSIILSLIYKNIWGRG